MTGPISDDKLAEIRAGLEGVTPGPYEPCVHLRSKEGDDNCSCGYRGGVWSTSADEIIFEMGGTAEHDGTKMVPEPDRDTRRLNAQHLARLDPQTVLALLARLDKAEELTIAPLDWRMVEPAWWEAYMPALRLGYEVNQRRDGTVRLRCPGDMSYATFDGAIEEAKAAAQADFERRVRSALPTPPKEDSSNG